MVDRARKSLRDWAYPVIMAAMGFGIMVEAAFLVPVVQRQAEASKAGASARQRQCDLAPINEKTYRWFKASGVISLEELEQFRRGAPSREECAALRKRP